MADRNVFLTEKKNYNAVEFHKQFRDQLPQLVKVTHGYHGDTAEETFDKDEVLLIGTVGRQRRVVTKVQVPEGRCGRLSIPSSFMETLCIVGEDGKLQINKETRISNILSENKLPLVVQFPPNRTITQGRDRLATSQIPKLELIEKFVEITLLGSRYQDGVLNEEEIILIPLYVSQLRMSVISGIKGYSKLRWKQFFDEVEQRSLEVQYDMEYGNMEIAVYRPEVSCSGEAYTYEAPIRYDNIINIIQKLTKAPGNDEKCAESEHIYTPLEYEDEIKVTPSEKEPQYSSEYIHVEESNNIYEEYFIPTTVDVANGSKEPAKLTEDCKIASSEAKPTPEKKSLQSATKPRRPVPPTPRKAFPKPGFEQPSNVESNDAAAGNIAVASEQKQQTETVNTVPNTETAANFDTDSKLNYKQDHAPVPIHQLPPKRDNSATTIYSEQTKLSKETIAELSVKEVCEYLRKLNLAAYESSFHKQLIDGEMLIELDLDVLTKEFDMKKVEAMRLMRFAREGRLPKIT